MTAVQQPAAQDIPYEVRGMLLKLRKGAAASLNAARLREIFQFMPGWQIEKTKSFKRSRGAKAIKEACIPGIYSKMYRDYARDEDGLIHFEITLPGSVDDWATPHIYDEQVSEYNRLKDDILPELRELAKEEVGPKDKSYVRNVTDQVVPDRFGRGRQMLSVTFEFYAMTPGFMITAPDGQTFEVFGDYYKDGALEAKSFVDFYNWAVENTPFMESVLGLLQMEPVEQKEDPRSPYTPPPSAPESVKMIWAKLKDMTQGARDEQKAKLIVRLENDLQAFVEALKGGNEKEIEIARRYIGPLGWGAVANKELVPNWQEKVVALAEQEVEAMQNMFVRKNTMKLASIVEAKGNLQKVEGEIVVERGLLMGSMYVAFADNSNFRVQNSIVESYATNYFGHYTFFYRFPTTFHDVVMPDGTSMGRPSEERMNSVFVGK